jgi:hypothetical protein
VTALELERSDLVDALLSLSIDWRGKAKDGRTGRSSVGAPERDPNAQGAVGESPLH